MKGEKAMCDDYFEDDFDDGFDDDFDDGFETMDDSPINDNVELEDSSPNNPLSFENFLFWGGFLGMNIDEEREDRHRKKKKERATLEMDDVLDLDKKDEDY